jgi:hypothetical protein
MMRIDMGLDGKFRSGLPTSILRVIRHPEHNFDPMPAGQSKVVRSRSKGDAVTQVGFKAVLLEHRSSRTVQYQEIHTG